MDGALLWAMTKRSQPLCHMSVYRNGKRPAGLLLEPLPQRWSDSWKGLCQATHGGGWHDAGITNAGAYMREMALNGYILHVDLAPVKELVSLQRRCANNLN